MLLEPVEVAFTAIVLLYAYFHLTLDRENEGIMRVLDPEDIWGD